MFVAALNDVKYFESTFSKVEEYVKNMLERHQYRGVIYMNNEDGTNCVAEACVERLRSRYTNGWYNKMKMDIDYLADKDGCYIIITNRW